MKPLSEINTICEECARNLGFVPKDKAIGVWMDKCEVCGEEKPCTNLWHDWKEEK